MALPKFLQFGKSYAGRTINLSKDTGSELIDASQTSHSTIRLGSGSNTIAAGDYDKITMGAGGGTVYGARNETVTGGAGRDTFIFGVGAKPQTPGMIGSVEINNFDEAHDKLQLASFLGYSQISDLANAIAGDGKGGTLITLDSKGDSLHLTHVAPSTLTASDFKFGG